MKCKRCKATAVVALPSHHAGFCPECFLLYFERQVAKAIKSEQLCTKQDKILVALSGGKDSLALMLEMGRQGYDVTGFHVDLAIPDSSEQARAAVERFCAKHGFALRIKDMAAEGLAIPEVKRAVRRPICSVCGKIKRYFFNQEAREHGFTVLATGHNLDDEAARLFANVLRWDTGYLSDQGPYLPASGGFVSKIKPLFRLSEFETAVYSFLMGIDYHMGACPFSKGASFTGHKQLLADLDEAHPGQKLSFYLKFLKQGRAPFAAHERLSGDAPTPCSLCGYPTSAELCGVCRVRDAVQKA